MVDKPKIGLIVSTTRQGRFADAPAELAGRYRGQAQ